MLSYCKTHKILLNLLKRFLNFSLYKERMSTRRRYLFAFHVVIIFLCMVPHVPASNGTDWCQRLNISWLEKPPYVTALSATHMIDEVQLSGAFRYPLLDVLTKCCANLRRKKPLFVFRKANSSEELLRLLRKNETHIALPFVFNSTTGTYQEEYRFIPLFDHPGTEYYTTPVNNEPTQVLMEILLSSWPLFAFTFSLTAIAGIVIWATVSNTMSLFKRHWPQGVEVPPMLPRRD